MIGHVLTMHATEDGERIWLACSCGWKTGTVETSQKSQSAALQVALWRAGHAHLAEVSKI